MGRKVVPTLYRAILRHVNNINRQVKAGHTIRQWYRSRDIQDSNNYYNARESLLIEYPVLKEIITQPSCQARFAATRKLWNKEFESCTEEDPLDVGFRMLRQLGERQQLIDTLQYSGAFQPRHRASKGKNDLEFCVGDIVAVNRGNEKEATIGVIVGWQRVQSPETSHYLETEENQRVDYTIAMYDNSESDIDSAVVTTTECNIALLDTEENDVVINALVPVFFKSYEVGVGYIPSEALSARYPDDFVTRQLAEVVKKSNVDSTKVVVPSPNMLQIAEASEKELLEMLKSSDKSILPFVESTLQGYWFSEFGEAKAKILSDAMSNLSNEQDRKESKDVIRDFLLKEHPKWSSAWEVLGRLEYQDEQYEAAGRCYITALKCNRNYFYAHEGMIKVCLHYFSTEKAFHFASEIAILYPGYYKLDSIFKTIDGVVNFTVADHFY